MALKDYGVTTGVMPSGGGWRYEQPFAGGVQRIPYQGCAGTPDSLVKQVTEFRAAHMLELGDVEHDIAVYIKGVSPINNRYPKRDTPAPKIEVRKSYRAPIHRIGDWLLSVAPRQPRLILADDAIERGKICANCPQNVKWMVACVPCNGEVISRAQNLRQRDKCKEVDGLGACRLHDFLLPAAVFIDNEYLPERHPEAPEPCWLQRNL